jgi:hypothetical protein
MFLRHPVKASLTGFIYQPTPPGNPFCSNAAGNLPEKSQRFNVFCEYRVSSHSLYHATIANRRAPW